MTFLNTKPQMQDEQTQQDNDIRDLVQCIRDHKAQMEQHQSEIATLKVRLETILKARGTNWSDDTGYARMLSEGTRVHYGTEELDHLILTDPLRYGWLKDYRHESPTSARLQIK